MEEKTLSEEIIYQGKILKLKKIQVQLNNGLKSTREIVEHNGAVAIIVCENNKFLFVKQYRKAFEEILLEIPAGKLEIGEIPLECARRELEEETGYIADTLELIQIIYPSPGFCTEKIYLFKASDLSLGKINFDEDENIISEWIEKDKLVEMIGEGKIKDAKSLLGVVLYTPFL